MRISCTPGLIRFILLGFIFSLCFVATDARSEEETLEQMRASSEKVAKAKPVKPHPAVVRVKAQDRGNSFSFGTGTLIGRSDKHGLVVTNWHVIRDAVGKVSVVFPDGFTSTATILHVNKTWDLAALLIWRPKVEPVAIAKERPTHGQLLSIAGYGSGTYRFASGKVVNFTSPGKNNPFDFVEIAVSARNGDSGGPIFNMNGELAGVLFGSAKGRTDGSYCGRVAWFVRGVLSRFEKVKKAMEFKADLSKSADLVPEPYVEETEETVALIESGGSDHPESSLHDEAEE